ncbi:MAG: hypothetical protein K2P59_06445 [Acetatifactor sp.]|nr:hypothetical protein [Acetatifactor sp.]
MFFLHNTAVEPDNNLAERCARKFKRKAARVMCFRSQSIKAAGEELYESVTDRFNIGLEVGC